MFLLQATERHTEMQLVFKPLIPSRLVAVCTTSKWKSLVKEEMGTWVLDCLHKASIWTGYQVRKYLFNTLDNIGGSYKNFKLRNRYFSLLNKEDNTVCNVSKTILLLFSYKKIIIWLSLRWNNIILSMRLGSVLSFW